MRMISMSFIEILKSSISSYFIFCAYVVTTIYVHQTLYIPQTRNPPEAPTDPICPDPRHKCSLLRRGPGGSPGALASSPIAPRRRRRSGQVSVKLIFLLTEQLWRLRPRLYESNQCVVHAFSFSPITRENKENPRVVKCIVHNSTRSVGPCT